MIGCPATPTGPRSPDRPARRGNVALEGCSEAVAKALLDTRKSRKPAVEELWFPINDQQEGSGAVDLVQQLEYAEVMGHDEL